MDEKAIIERCQNGDVAAFEELIAEYQKKVINSAYAMLGNREDAYDMAQEIFLKVFGNISKFNRQSSFSTWLYRVTRNMCLDEIRRRKRRDSRVVNITGEKDEEIYDLQIADTAKGPEEIAEQDAVVQQVRGAINELSEDYKTAMILREIQELDYQQIADVLECSIGTVKSRISRGRKMLREKLSECEELFT